MVPVDLEKEAATSVHHGWRQQILCKETRAEEPDVNECHNQQRRMGQFGKGE